jgi:hypothetical protein
MTDKITIIAALLALAGCAASPADEQRRQDMEADIDEIMSYELDETEFGEASNCLSSNQYRSFRPLGDRHLVFEGRKNKQWVNVLRGRCPGLRADSIFIMKPTMSGRSCEMDQFEAVDRTGDYLSGGRGATCVLGVFKPVAKAQLQEIETRLEMR